jgi:hypothetical protein
MLNTAVRHITCYDEYGWNDYNRWEAIRAEV